MRGSCRDVWCSTCHRSVEDGGTRCYLDVYEGENEQWGAWCMTPTGRYEWKSAIMGYMLANTWIQTHDILSYLRLASLPASPLQLLLPFQSPPIDPFLVVRRYRPSIMCASTAWTYPRLLTRLRKITTEVANGESVFSARRLCVFLSKFWKAVNSCQHHQSSITWR
jgi:hypothetical protein